MDMTLPGIEFSKTKRNPTLASDDAIFELSFYKDAEYFSILENLNEFIKATENIIRKSKYYSRYVKYIKEDIGLKQCQVLSNLEIDEESKITLEMHHGPILTLYDYVLIVIDCLLEENHKKITTFLVADIVMREHYNNNIQVVMLTKTVHEAVDEGLFLNYKQGFGNINEFLKKYRKGLSKDQIFKINSYVELCDSYNSFDNLLLELKDTVRNWSKENII